MVDDFYNDNAGDGEVHFADGQMEAWVRYITNQQEVVLTGDEVNRLVLTLYRQHILNKELVFLTRLLAASHESAPLRAYLNAFDKQADATGNAYNNLIKLFMARGADDQEAK